MSKWALKCLSFTLGAAMLFSVATGCASSKTQKTSSTKSEKQIVKNLNGRTIKISAFWDEAPKAGTPEGDRKLARIAEIEKKYNCKIQFINVAFDKTPEMYTASVMAGEPFADIVSTDSRWFLGLAGKGFIQELNNLIDMNNAKWDPMTKNASTLNGKVYGMRAGKWEPGGMFFFNKTIFAKEGLPDLYELQKNKQWTWDKFREIAKAATKDTNGDGTIDQWGYGGIGSDMAFIVSNGGTSIDTSKEKPQIALKSPQAVQALEFYYNLVNVDKVVFSKFTVKNAPWAAALQAMKDGKLAMFSFQYFAAGQFAKDMADEYGLVHFPMGPSNKTGDYRLTIDSPNYKTIPKNVKNPEDGID